MKCVKLTSNSNNSLCNQLYFIAYSITDAISSNKKIFVLDKFYTDVKTQDNCPISFILDLYKTNIFLEKYNIKIIDPCTLTFKIISVQLGNDENVINITDKIMNLQNKDLFKNKMFHMSKDLNLLDWDNGLSCSIKKVYIEYEISGYIFINDYSVKNGFLTEDIHINTNPKFLKYDIHENYKKIENKKIENKTIINDLIQNIQFHYKYLYRAQNIINNTKNTNNIINVIHLRMENDAIDYWSKINNISPALFKQKTEEKYISLIQKYVEPEHLTIILSYETQNNVIYFLKKNSYNIFMNKKYNEQGREINAIQDMCIGEYCNNILIGPTLSSMFSDILYLRLKSKDDIQLITFNMEKIDHEEQIY